MKKPKISPVLLTCIILLGTAGSFLADPPASQTFIVGEGASPWSDKVNDLQINHVPAELVGNGPFPQTLFASLALTIPAGAKSVVFSVSPDDLPLLKTNNPTVALTGESLSVDHSDGTGSVSWPIVKLVSPPAQVGGAGFHSGLILLNLDSGNVAITSLATPTPDPDMPSLKVEDLKLDYPERRVVMDKGNKAVVSKNYAEMEQTDKTLIATNALLSDGMPQSELYEDGFLEDCPDDAAWKARISDIEAWCAAKPDSVFAASVLANYYVGYGWFARGSGYADTVTAEGARLMDERLAKARDILEKTRAQHPTENLPLIWYRGMDSVALGQGMPFKDRYQLFQEATAKYPSNFGLYFDVEFFLMEKWYGNKGDWEKFAEECGKEKGVEYYTRICWDADANYEGESFFTDTEVKWPLMKKGFEQILTKTPTSLWNINNFCYFACMAGDLDTARPLFKLIGRNWYRGPWHDGKEFGHYRSLALGKGK